MSLPLPGDFTLVGFFQKPYGLLGEMKVRPETFDFDRHQSLRRVFARDRAGGLTELVVRATRGDGTYWYLKFEDRRTPEAVAALSGQELLIDSAEKLPLPEGMVYFSELPGMRVLNENGAPEGEVVEVREAGSVEYIVIRTAKGELPVPWNEHFVREIDAAARTVRMDLSSLRGVLL